MSIVGSISEHLEVQTATVDGTLNTVSYTDVWIVAVHAHSRLDPTYWLVNRRVLFGMNMTFRAYYGGFAEEAVKELRRRRIDFVLADWWDELALAARAEVEACRS